jgi:molecular chaperone DnaK (HSP70)
LFSPLFLSFILVELSSRDITLDKKKILSTTHHNQGDSNLLTLLYQECRKCKEYLSEHSEYVFSCRCILDLLTIDYPVLKGVKLSNKEEFLITRETLEKWISPIINQLEETVRYTFTQFRETLQREEEQSSADLSLPIDEIVLVGGSSQIPVIQSRIRKVCQSFGIRDFAMKNDGTSTSNKTKKSTTASPDHENNDKSQRREEPKEFCQSINPNFAVVEGLAIRGAILSGEDSSLLKNILMLDCLPMNIGILLWDEDKKDKFFEPILFQGMKLPIQNIRKRISLEIGNRGRKQTHVPLEIYEEVEEVQQSSSSSSNGKETTTQQNMKYFYYLLVSCDVLIEKKKKTHNANRQTKSGNHRERKVDIIFSVDEECSLSYRVEEVRDGDEDDTSKEETKHKDHLEESDSLWNGQTRLLLLYSFFLLLIYVAAKYLFQEATITTPPPL